MSNLDSDDSRNIFERFLGLFADVCAGESTMLGLLTLNGFILLLAYYILTPMRTNLMIAAGRPEAKTYAGVVQVFVLLGSVELYAILVSRLPRRRLLNVVTLFFAACLAVFYILIRFQLPVGVVFYVWAGICNTILMAQFWAFAVDVYTPEAGKRLFAIVVFGVGLGAFGVYFVNLLPQLSSAYWLLLVSAGLMVLSLFITNAIDTRDRNKVSAGAVTRVEEVERPLPKGSAFRLVFRSRYLILIALLMLLLNWVDTTGEYILSRTVWQKSEVEATAPATQEIWQKEYEEELAAGNVEEGTEEEFIEDNEAKFKKSYIGRFYANFYSVANLATLLIQLFVVSRILKYLGVRIALLVLPFISLGVYAILAFYPMLSIVRWAWIARIAVTSSLQYTVAHVLFLPVTREQKYKAKLAIGTLFPRIGDVGAALTISGTSFLSLKSVHFTLANLVLVSVWVILATLLGRENRRLTSRSN